MRIGTMFFGRVDDVLGEGIETKFFVLGVPLFPMGSYYFTQGRRGFEIPLHGKSVALGYARMALWLTALLWGILGWVTKHYSDGPEVLIGPLLVAGVASYFTWGVGRVSRADKSKRLVLRVVAGLAADPAILPIGLRDEIHERLESTWTQRNPGRAWRTSVDAPQLDPQDATLLYALAAYARETGLTERAWERAKGNGGGPVGPYR